jgi:hypothetical protein
MSSPFVPFLKSGPPGPSPRTPLTTDNALASGAFVALGNASAPGGTASVVRAKTSCTHSPANPPAAPAITLQKDGDRVTHIRIECSCGQVVELECAY